MKKLESFLNSGLYIALIFTITFVSWSFYHETPPTAFNLYNMIGLFVLILINTIVLGLFRNTLYSVPVLVAVLFIINKSDISFDNLSSFSYPIVSFTTLLLGYAIHWIRFKPNMKKGVFFIGFGLIALSYIIPLLYTPFKTEAIPVSLMGTIFFGFYIFYSSTLKSNLNYLFKIMIFANILLTAQVFFYIYQGYLLFPDMDFYHRIFQGWQRNLGWANINDMCFYISLTLPSYFYFIFKKQRIYLNSLLLILPVVAVVLTKSRGGMISFGISIIGLALLMLYKGNRKLLTIFSIFIVIFVLFFILNSQLIQVWIESFIDSFTVEDYGFFTGRKLIYQVGLEVFRQHPLFGGGWMSISIAYDRWIEVYGLPQRLFMFHSTLIQALATMGLFGLGALFVHYFQIGKFMLKSLNLEKSLFIIGYIATQVHGLIDNVQYAVPYSVLIVLFLSIYETSEKQTSFEVINKRYYLIEEK
ncbi:MAG: O-antigen ligase family protein [Acholeplasmataceae bacterium]|nr:O-antigen ligase family protein [Acholeplasmataceae bacterium]